MMAEEPDNHMLAYLCRIDNKLDRVYDAVVDVQGRVSSLERQVASLHGDVAGLHGDFAGQSIRTDKIENRLLRIDRRLDLADA